MDVVRKAWNVVVTIAVMACGVLLLYDWTMVHRYPVWLYAGAFLGLDAKMRTLLKGTE